MSETTQQTQAKQFHFPETLNLDGEQYTLMYDPGNPQRPQVLPNYRAMLPQPSSCCQQVELPGLGRKWMTIIDAVIPAQAMTQTGGAPAMERRFLCFRIYDVFTDPMITPPAEMVMYALGNGQDGSRSQRLLNTLLGMAEQQQANKVAPDTDWTRQLAEVQAQKTSSPDARIAVPKASLSTSVEQDDEQD